MKLNCFKTVLPFADMNINAEFINFDEFCMPCELHRINTTNETVNEQLVLSVRYDETLTIVSETPPALMCACDGTKYFFTPGMVAIVKTISYPVHIIIYIKQRRYVLNRVYSTLPLLLKEVGLVNTNMLCLHSCTVNLNGRGIVFIGLSESGKSTTARIASRSGLDVLSDEMSLVMLENDHLWVFGTPVSSTPASELVFKRDKLPLAGLIVLNKAQTFALEKVKPTKGLRIVGDNLLNNILPTLNEVVAMIASIPLYKMDFTKDDIEWKTIEKRIEEWYHK